MNKQDRSWRAFVSVMGVVLFVLVCAEAMALRRLVERVEALESRMLWEQIPVTVWPLSQAELGALIHGE